MNNYKMIRKQSILERMTMLQGNRYYDLRGKEIPKYLLAWSSRNLFELLRGNTSVIVEKREKPHLEWKDK